MQAGAKLPTTAVVAPLDINPQILMWDPGDLHDQRRGPTSPRPRRRSSTSRACRSWTTWSSKGYVEKAQLDSSFDGTPSRFVAEGGKIIQQGYASNEPYRWEHDVDGWKKPVKYLLVHDSGYQIYPQGLAVRAGAAGDVHAPASSSWCR